MRAEHCLGTVLAVGALLVGTLTGCTDAGADPVTATPASPAPSPPVDPSTWSYAALGDSYSAAPFVPQTDLAGGCFRSSGNYPSLVSEDLGITDVRDVTCSGADTDDIAGRQVVTAGQGTVPAQLKAVTSDTDLVTLGIGGNDENLFATLVHECTTIPPGGSPCLDLVGPEAASASDVIRRTAQRVATVLDLVHRKAPDARVLLVGYPRLVDPDRPCALIPIDRAELPRVADFERELRDALARAASRGDAEFLDVYAESRGHEICSDDPWVNGRETDQARALAYHPFDVEQRAVADLVGEARRDGGLVTGTLASLVERDLMAADWAEALAPVEGTIEAMGRFLREEIAAGRGYLPAGDHVLRAFSRPLADVKVLVVGQDPYPTPGHPVGLSFSVASDVRPLPPSLVNIYKELVNDLGVDPPSNGDLTPWADHGVLLLNRCLTVQAGKSAAHRGRGWEKVTDRAIEALAGRGGPLAAILWGRDAQSLKPMLGPIPWVESVHPSPLSASRGFFGSRPFSKVNALLERQGGSPVDWTLP